MELVKPLLRGHFHQAALFISMGACTLMLSETTTWKSFWAVLIYSITLVGLFGISALYHRVHWQQEGRKWMRRMDHSAIFLLIAGTATPVGALVLNGPTSIRFLSIIWIGAILGVLQSLFWIHAPKWVAASLAVILGWVSFPYLIELQTQLGTSGVTFFLLGGVFYTLGAVIYAIKKPNPFPKVFGYHEIFHLLVVLAAVFHFVVILKVIRTSI